MKRVFQTFIGAGAGTSPMRTLACGKVQIMKHINLERNVMLVGEKKLIGQIAVSLIVGALGAITGVAMMVLAGNSIKEKE